MNTSHFILCNKGREQTPEIAATKCGIELNDSEMEFAEFMYNRFHSVLSFSERRQEEEFAYSHKELFVKYPSEYDSKS